MAAKLKPNKRVVPRAASFVKIARDLRQIGKTLRRKAEEAGTTPEVAELAQMLAEVLEAEAKRLRAMR